MLSMPSVMLLSYNFSTWRASSSNLALSSDSTFPDTLVLVSSAYVIIRDHLSQSINKFYLRMLLNKYYYYYYYYYYYPYDLLFQGLARLRRCLSQ